MQTIKEQLKSLLSTEQYNFWIEPTLEIVDEYGKSTLVVKMEACQSVIAVMLKQHGVEGQVIFEAGQKEYQYPTKKPISVCNEAKREEVGQSAQEEYPKSSDVIKSGKLDEKFWAEKIAKLDEKFGRKRRIGWEAIKYLTSKEIPVKLFFAKSDDNDIKNYSLNLESEQKDNKERYKICLIGKLLCLDIDRKNGIDGIASFYDYFKKRGVEKERLPLYLQNIDKGSYPFYMSTPSGGLHLYFKYLGKCPDGKLCDGVEIKNKQLSGGYKDDKPYVLHGDIEDMQRIPPILLKEIIPKPKQVKQERIFSAAQKYKSESKREFPSWSKITEYTDEDGKGTQGRNSRAFSLALHARTHGYDINETLENLMQDQSVNELPQKELSDVVKSAYKKA